jgi:hypothetical protein
LTEEVIAEVERLALRALYIETIAECIGFHRVTLHRWIKIGGIEQRRRERGLEPNPKYDLHCKLCYTIKRSLAKTESDLLWHIQNAGAVQWQALAWILERRNPQRWGQNRDQLKALAASVKDMEQVVRGTVRQEPQGQTRTRRKLSKAAVE